MFFRVIAVLPILLCSLCKEQVGSDDSKLKPPLEMKIDVLLSKNSNIVVGDTIDVDISVSTAWTLPGFDTTVSIKTVFSFGLGAGVFFIPAPFDSVWSDSFSRNTQKNYNTRIIASVKGQREIWINSLDSLNTFVGGNFYKLLTIQ